MATDSDAGHRFSFFVKCRHFDVDAFFELQIDAIGRFIEVDFTSYVHENSQVRINTCYFVGVFRK